MKVIIVTVGTSLYENYNKGKSDDKIPIHEIFGNKGGWEKLDKCCSSFFEKCKNWIEEKYKRWKKRQTTDSSTLSAEIISTMQIINQHIENEEDVEIHLVASFTCGSYFCAKLIELFFNEIYEKPSKIERIRAIFDPDKDCIEGLQVEKFDDFKEKGLLNFIERVKQLIPEDEKSKKKRTKDVLLNITGGYKVLIPYMSLMGFLYGISLYYKYEGSNDLIKIPALNIYKIEDTIMRNYEILKAAAKNVGSPFSLDISKKRMRLLCDNSLIERKSDKKVVLTPVGDLFVSAFKDADGANLIKALLGVIVESKAYEHIVEKYFDERNKLSNHFGLSISKIYGSKKFSIPNGAKKEIEIDIWIEGRKVDTEERKYIAIEIKPGYNVEFEKIKNKVKEVYSLKKIKNIDIEMYVFLYTYKNDRDDEICEKVKEKAEKLCKESEIAEKVKELGLKWCHLKIQASSIDDINSNTKVEINKPFLKV